MDNNWNNWNNWNNTNEQNVQPEVAATEHATEAFTEGFAEELTDAVEQYVPTEEYVAEQFEQTYPEPTFTESIQKAVYHDIPSTDYSIGSDGSTESYRSFGSYENSIPASSAYESSKATNTKGYVTKKLLAIALICTMLATSALTVGGLALAGVFNKKYVSAYNNNIPSATYTNSETAKATLPIQEVASINENAVVEIQTESLVTDFWLQNYVTQGAGSGVLIDSDGYILTCYHVIENARSITVTTKNGAHYDATVVGYDELTDLAVIKIKGSNFTTVTYGDSSTLTIGDSAVVIGNPLGQLGGSISTGIISALDRSVVVEGKAMTLIQTDAAINPGNSGGGLFDGSGSLIGIVVAKAGDSSSNVEGIGFAIPINKAAIIADQLIEHGKVPRPLIGVMIVDVTNETAAQQFGVKELGLFIDEVSGENAKAAGFQKGDIIKSVNGTAIRNRYDLTVELSKFKAGDKVKVTVSRNGEMIEIETVLQEGE
ncbi:MAG: trypsin-like peptidase domain-containing protein [Firmicutes bacterium]|nr:trypsin-like peptidase domain-containing protein [Bacillota bacterium]